MAAPASAPLPSVLGAPVEDCCSDPAQGENLPRVFTAEEVSQHVSPDDCWVSLCGKVFDVTSFLLKHPGGQAALSKPGRAGSDVTDAFMRVGHSSQAEAILQTLYLGDLLVVGYPVQQPEADSNAVSEEELTCVSWHACRRMAILNRHPEIAQLLQPNPWTLAIIAALAVLHSLGVMIAMHADSVMVTFTLAYTWGACCKMWQFAMAHEICHGTVAACLDRHPHMKAFCLHLSAVPAIGSHIYDYYAFMHIGHHTSFGLNEQGVGLLSVFADQTIDGDLWSTHVLRVALNRIGLRDGKDQFEFLHQPYFVRLILFDVCVHLYHFCFLLFFCFFEGISLMPYVLVRLFSSRKRLQKMTAKERVGSTASDADIYEMLRQWGHCALHVWLWVFVDFCLLQCTQCSRVGGANTRWLHGLVYLILSELFYRGFLCHPFYGFWLSTHCTGKGAFEPWSVDTNAGGDTTPGTLLRHEEMRPKSVNLDDGRKKIQGVRRRSNPIVGQYGRPEANGKEGDIGFCQPTMSTYSLWSGLSSANLTYHVEHHDFPTCPWNRLPQIRQKAPEFYGNLRQSAGFLHTLREYLRHGHSWRYSCID